MDIINKGDKHMKNIYRLSALACIAVVFNGCVEENLEPIKPAQNGDEIIFGARAGFEDSDPSTKTVYSGQTYESDGKTFERIDWLDDGSDKIEIYCQQAANGPRAHYTIHDASKKDDDDDTTVDYKDEAVLTRIGDGALQWNGDGNHTFYAMYPSSMMFTDDPNKTVETGIYMSSSDAGTVIVNGIIPTSQQPTVEEVIDPDGNGTGNYVAKPDMKYAYMVAKSTSNRTKGSVGLTFAPIVTALEVVLFNANATTVNVGEIQISSPDEPIVGSFNADLTTWDGVGSYPNCSITKTDEENKIQITTRILDDDNLPVAVPIAAGKSLKFTVFLLPGADDKMINNLKIGISITGVNYKEKNLNGANIKQHLKTRISKLELPTLTIQGDKWMENIENSVSFKALSLPGTGGSFTYDATNDSFKQQTLSFEDQWKLGIRAFELQSERPSSGSTSLGGQSVTCNKEPVADWTVLKVLTTLIDKVSGENANKVNGNFTETAALILTYQPKGGTPGRDPVAYAQSLKQMLKPDTEGTANCLTSEQYEKIIAYTPDLNMENARGKVILICRPTQRNEDAENIFGEVSNALQGVNITAIDGCGSAKDKWGARGYRIAYGIRDYSRTAYESGSFLSPYSWSEYQYGSYDYSPKVAYEISNNPLTTGRHQTESYGVGLFGPSNANAYQKGYEIEGDTYVEAYMQDASLFTEGQVSNDGTIKYPTSYNSGKVTRPEALKMPTITNGVSDGLNFGYITNQGTLVCWYQEWARVVPELALYAISGGSWIDYSSTNWGGSHPSYNYDPINWFESYSEKLSNVITTFEMAISNNYTNFVFINSLSGYLATDSTDPTYSLVPSLGYVYGGDGGDVQGLADKLNPSFYEYVLNSGMEEATGPTGIVLMDFVSDSESAGGAYYLPGTIIANNFKFD